MKKIMILVLSLTYSLSAFAADPTYNFKCSNAAIEISFSVSTTDLKTEITQTTSANGDAINLDYEQCIIDKTITCYSKAQSFLLGTLSMGIFLEVHPIEKVAFLRHKNFLGGSLQTLVCK